MRLKQIIPFQQNFALISEKQLPPFNTTNTAVEWIGSNIVGTTKITKKSKMSSVFRKFL